MANYLYNGVLLPDINEVWTDKEMYPYAAISETDDGFRLLLSDKFYAYRNGMGDLEGISSKSAAEYIYTKDSGEWGYVGTDRVFGIPRSYIIWVNFYMYNYNPDNWGVDDTVALAPSDPVSPAVYMDIGGVRKKVTAYKDIGGVRRKISEAGASLPAVGTSLEDCTWEQISAISAAGKAAEYFSVGDTKSVYLKGTVGTLELDTTLYVYILGFDHNSEIEGKGITFGTFKTADGVDVALIDSKYESNDTSGTKYFNMNHWGYSNYGGWAGCDMRYDILGSTDKAPLGYGAAKTTSVVGYDPSGTCATSPVTNTLMAALPSELRAVMKPMTKYTNNTGASGDTEEKVTVTTEYLPLLAEFEILGARTYANGYEKNKQKQYDYYAYAAGNSRVKYRHSSTGSAAYWWERSANCCSEYNFCRVYTNGGANTYTSDYAFGIAPIFLV